MPSTAMLMALKSCSATASPHISGVAAKAGVDVNQPRAMGNTTESSGRSCATEHRRLAGGRIGVTTGGRRASSKAQQGALKARIQVELVKKIV
jgi:hypothetical protein